MDPNGRPRDRRGVAIAIFLLAFALAIVAFVRVVGDDGSDSVEVLPSVEITAGQDAMLSTDDLVGDQRLVLGLSTVRERAQALRGSAREIR